MAALLTMERRSRISVEVKSSFLLKHLRKSVQYIFWKILNYTGFYLFGSFTVKNFYPVTTVFHTPDYGQQTFPDTIPGITVSFPCYVQNSHNKRSLIRQRPKLLSLYCACSQFSRIIKTGRGNVNGCFSRLIGLQ